MMRLIIVGFVGVMLSMMVYGQSDNNKAPLDPEYIDYLENPEKYTTGFIPHPFKMQMGKVKLKSSIIYPEVFDLRNLENINYVTAIKNQGAYGTCWAFAAMSSIESYWLRSMGLELDLSERNMAHCHGFEWGPEEGGNSVLAASYLTRLSGPYLEEYDPYSNMGNAGCVDFGDTIHPAGLITNYYLTGGVELTKYMLYKYGTVATSMSTEDFYTYYNTLDNTFFYKGSSGVDHGVSIVGWNDTIEVRGSASGNPLNPGVWIVKNSWGETFGEDGFFYVSYEDAHVGRKVSIYPGRAELNEVDTLYMNDFLGAVGSHGFPEASNKEVGYALQKFTANQKQLINRLGSFVNTGGTMINFVVARNWDGTNLIDTLGMMENLICRFPGYHSFETAIEVDSGDFYVMARYNTPGNNYPMPVEEYETGFAVPVLEIGNQWASKDGISWKAFGSGLEFEKDLCIRVYAKNLNDITAAFVSDRKIYCLGMETNYINQTIGVADSFVWNIRDGLLDTSFVTFQLSDTLKYQYQSTGLKTVRLVACNTLKRDTLLRTNYIDVVESPDVYISLQGNRTTVARDKPITITAFGAEEFLWDLGDGNWTETDQVLSLTPELDQQWVKVRGFLGSCTSMDSILIKTVVVDYDDIKDAKQLDVNVEYGPFSNRYATVEENEPAPPEGDCDNQTEWCVEGGLHNSIWFTFVAPPTGEVNIVTNGFDNQIALYDAKSSGGWEDILSGDETKFEIIAANDDAHDEDYSAEIDMVSNLVPEKRYWIQADGSAGGDEGEMMIKIKATLPTLQRFPIQVAPNPYVVSMTVDLRGLNLEPATIRIYSMDGRCLLQETVTDNYYTIDRNTISSGHYIIDVRSEREHYIAKFSCID